MWANAFRGAASNDIGQAIAVDVAGNVVVGGYFDEAADFDPGAGVVTLTTEPGNDNGFIVKLASDGSLVWARSLASSEPNAVSGLAIDGAGNIYANGGFTGTADFDPGTGVNNVTSAGESDIYVWKLDNSGDLVWVQTVGNASADGSSGLALDSSGSSHITGYFSGTVDFDPGAGVSNLTSAAANDAFVLKLGTDGDYRWAKSIGGANEQQGYDIDVDESGNAFIAIGFNGTTDFDPNVGTENVTPQGGYDVATVKLNSSGDFVWVQSVGGNGDDFPRALAVDDSGNVYAAGDFHNTVDFDPTAGTFNLSGVASGDVFVVKLSQRQTGDYTFPQVVPGDYVVREVNQLGWRQTLPSLSEVTIGEVNEPPVAAGSSFAFNVGANGSDIGRAVVTDVSGNVYVVGEFEGTVDFDPSPGVVSLTSFGDTDAFVAKYTATGALAWARQLGGSNADLGLAAALDSNGHLYITGYFAGTADFDPGTDTFNLTSGGSDDAFVSKLDADGNFLWARRLGGSSRVYASGIGVDGVDNVYIAGGFQGTADLDPGTGTTNLTSAGVTDGYVTKLDSTGNFVWARQFGGSGNDGPGGMTVDDAGNVYTTGSFQSTADFDPGVDTFNLVSAGDNDAFVSKLDANGDFVWARRLGASQRDQAYSIAVDGGGSVYTTGIFHVTVDFDPGPGTANLTSAGEFRCLCEQVRRCRQLRLGQAVGQQRSHQL